MNHVPDVTVIVAVYNTMPYLTACLDSLVEQSIGLDNMEIVAVDDGSTDGGGKEIDRFADQYPGTIKVLHQPNSGGPAAPCNRALELATGRYVYFIGADDYLGTEALERLVKAADEYESDVVVGKMVGVNGRYVHKSLFKRTEIDIGLHDSPLPWSLSNCKLFRRDLIERYGLRYREDMPVCSDQPFTIEACVRARRISVLADYDYYHAVRRADSSNITFRTSLLTHMECGVELIEFTARLMEPGPARDMVLVRHFTWEMGKLVGAEFPGFDPAMREELCAGIKRVADRYLTDAIRDGIRVDLRVRLALAQRGAMDELCAAIGMDTAKNGPPLVMAGDRAYVRYPGFGDDRLGLPDDCFAISDNLTRRIAAGVKTSSVEWDRDAGGRPALTVTAHAALTGPSALDPDVVRVVVAPLPGGRQVPGARRRRPGQQPPDPLRQVIRTASRDGIRIHARIPVNALLAAHLAGARRVSVRLDVDVAGTTYEIPVSAAGSVAQLRYWYRARPYRISPISDDHGRLVVAVAPIRLTRVVKQRLRRPAVVTKGARS